MRICIPTRGDEGLDAECAGHFGRAPFFTVVDTGSDEVVAIPNPEIGRRHGTCHPLRRLRDEHLEAIVCTGIGRGAYSQLRAQGIDVYTTPHATVAQIVASARAGTLRRIDSEGTCDGAGHHREQHRHGSGHCGGQHE